MKKQFTKSSLDNNEQNQGENIKNMNDSKSSRNKILSITDKDPVEIKYPQKNSGKTFTEIRTSRRLKKFFPLDIEDYDFNYDIQDDKIEELVNNIASNVNIHKEKRRMIKKEGNFNSVTVPSLGLNKSLQELPVEVKPTNNIETFQNENIEMYKRTTNVKPDSRLKTIKKNKFKEPKMKLKTEIDQSITKPSLLKDNFNTKKTAMNKSALPKQHSKTNTKFDKTEEKEDMDDLELKKLLFMTSLKLIKKKNDKTNSEANKDGIKPELSQQTSIYILESSIRNEDKTERPYQTRPVKKNQSGSSETYSNERENNQMLHIPILGPEKLLGSVIHPERVCKSHCRMCSIKFGSLDIPHHITEIKNPMTPDFESKCLTNHRVKTDSCLCGLCFRVIKKKNYNKITTSEFCNVTTCNNVATETFQSEPMSTIISNLIEKGIEFKTWTNETKSIAICESHLKKILKLTECQLCGSQSQEKFNRRMFPLYLYNRVFEVIALSIKLNKQSLICENCHYYFINHISYSCDSSNKVYIEIRSDILISICKYKNMKLPEFFFMEEWLWNYVQPKGTPRRQPPTATQMCFILALSVLRPISQWRRALNQLALVDIRWTIMPQGTQRPKWVSFDERIALAVAAGSLPDDSKELDTDEQEDSDTSVEDADDMAVLQPEEILDPVAPAIPIQTLPKTISTMQPPMSNVDDIIRKKTEVGEIADGDVNHTENQPPADIVLLAELSSSKDITAIASAAKALSFICDDDEDDDDNEDDNEDYDDEDYDDEDYDDEDYDDEDYDDEDYDDKDYNDEDDDDEDDDDEDYDEDDAIDTTPAGVDSDTETTALAYTTTAKDSGGKRAAAEDGDSQPLPPSKLAKFSNGSGHISTVLADASKTDIIYPEHGQTASAYGVILRNFVRK